MRVVIVGDWTADDLARLRELHAGLDELAACFLSRTDRRPSSTSVLELMEWAYQQISAEPFAAGRLRWRRHGAYEEALLGDFEGGDGVRFSLEHRPTCYRRGSWRLLVEVAPGPHHNDWGCFDAADQPERNYHSESCARREAQSIADVLLRDRKAKDVLDAVRQEIPYTGDPVDAAATGEGIDARRDVIERRVLAHGETVAQWAIEVTNPVDRVWTASLYVGVQSFQFAVGQDSEGEQHCMLVGRMFVKALKVLLDVEMRPLRQAIVTANDQLFDSREDDPQHQIDSHADTLPQVFLKLAAGHDAAFETLQEIIREWVEPTPTVGLGSGSEPSSVLGGEVVAQEPSMNTDREVRRVTDAHGPAGGTLDGSGRRTDHAERVLGLQGHCPRCNAKIGESCKTTR